MKLPRKSEKIALFIGRFQPFHIGHLKVVKLLSKRYGLVKIVIGSAQDSGTLLNPFSAKVRKRMILNTLKKEKIRNFRLICIKDIQSDERYASHVRRIVGHFDVIYSGTPLVKKLFRKDKHKVVHLPRYYSLSATKIRKILKKSKDWKKFVHEEVRKIILR